MCWNSDYQLYIKWSARQLNAGNDFLQETDGCHHRNVCVWGGFFFLITESGNVLMLFLGCLDFSSSQSVRAKWLKMMFFSSHQFMSTNLQKWSLMGSFQMMCVGLDTPRHSIKINSWIICSTRWFMVCMCVWDSVHEGDKLRWRDERPKTEITLNFSQRHLHSVHALPHTCKHTDEAA